MDALGRISRWDTKPGKTGLKPNTPGDLEILNVLGRYTLLTIKDITALTGRSYEAIKLRLRKMKRKPYELVQVCNAQSKNPRLYHWYAQAFHLTPRGAAKITPEDDLPKPSNLFEHQLTENQVVALFEAGIHRVKLLPRMIFEDVHFYLHSKEYKRDVKPDGRPIQIGDKVFVLEVDCDSEDLTSTAKTHSVIDQKFAAYLTILSEQKYPNLYVLFTTVTERRMKTMMALLERLAGKEGRRYLPYFAFHVFPTLLYGKQPTELTVWGRVGHPPLILERR